MGMPGFDSSMLVLQSSIGKDVIPIQNIHSAIIDNKLIAKISQGETLGTRQDAKVVKFVPVAEQELELAA